MRDRQVNGRPALGGTVLLSLIVVLVVLVFGAAATAQDTVPYTLAIKTDESSFKAGAGIVVHITLKNISRGPLTVYRDMSSEVAERMGFTADIRDARKKPAPLTEYGRLFYRQALAFTDAPGPVSVGPGQ